MAQAVVSSLLKKEEIEEKLNEYLLAVYDVEWNLDSIGNYQLNHPQSTISYILQGFAEAYEIIDKIKPAPKRTRRNKNSWHYCDVELPPKDTYYRTIIYCSKAGIVGSCMYWNGFNRSPYDDGSCEFKDIVAWMYAPEPCV